MSLVSLTREQLEERLAALHQASLELVQDVSLESLLERIAAIARQQAAARYAAVGVLDEHGRLENFITLGMKSEEIAKMDHPPVGLGLIGELMQSRDPIRLAHISDDPRSLGFPMHHPMMDSFLGVPIRLGERQLGQIYLTEKIGASEFTLADQLVIETLASYAAVAIANARMLAQLTERDRVLTLRNQNLGLVNTLASTLSTAEDIDQVLEKALVEVMDHLSMEVGEVYLREEDSKNLRLDLHRGESCERLFNRQRFTFSDGLVGQAARTGQPAMLVLPGVDGSELHPSVEEAKIRQVACFPLTGRRGVSGVLCMASSRQEPLDELQMQFLSAISSWVGTEIENVRLNLNQRRLAVLEERERIGMDLHDGVIQSIYAVGLTLEHARLLLMEDTQQSRTRIEQAIKDLNSTIRDIRAYILDLRPRQLHDENLMQGIERLTHEFRANTFVEVQLKGPADGLARLPAPQATALFHICQEALANIAKHARAKRVDVTVWTTAERVLLEVTDDGQGFEVDKIRLTIGHGLSNMLTRARNAGGDVEITSDAGLGTSILAWLPYDEKN
jgi:two-component system sensor histidine kinase DevS